MYMVERIIFEHNKVEGKQISFDISIFFFSFLIWVYSFCLDID